jgi:tRNA 2-selenouridine synthase
MKQSTTQNFKQIVVENTPLIDVRAPIEFEKGAFQHAINLPIMNNEERHLVGTCYKEQGNEAATRLGYHLVSGEIKEKRIEDWVSFINEHPNTMIYCFRGGSRSRITQEWIQETTRNEILRLEGGYKAFRNFLMNYLTPEFQTTNPLILGGYTGSGKTILLNQLDHAIDLEGIANHRGSSFGNHPSPQPTQINFENNLAYAIIQHQAKGYRHLILEDEGTNIGKRFIPKPLMNYFRSGKFVLLDIPLEERILITREEYVIQAQQEYCQAFGFELGLQKWYDYILESLEKAHKRLGDERYQRIIQAFKLAYQVQLESGDLEKHLVWIRILLEEYYDPMYRYQMEKNHQKVIYSGNTTEVLEFLKRFNDRTIDSI